MYLKKKISWGQTVVEVHNMSTPFTFRSKYYPADDSKSSNLVKSVWAVVYIYREFKRNKSRIAINEMTSE